MKSLYLYITLFFFILFAFFRNKKEQQTYTSIPEGVLYSMNSSSKTILNEENPEITETTLYKNPDASGLPTIFIYSEFKLPPKFIGKTTTKDNAPYIIYSSTSLPKVSSYYNEKCIKSKKQKTKSIKEQQLGETSNPYNVKKEEKEVINNFYTLNNYAKNSQKTYFFSGKEEILNDVDVRVYSLTPFQNRSILKFQISNSQQQYFFISNISIYDKGNNLILM